MKHIVFYGSYIWKGITAEMLEVEIIIDGDGEDIFPLDENHLARHAAKILENADICDGEINIVFIDDLKMSEMNEKYREKSGTTDVLSFRLSDDADSFFQGEIYISLKKAGEQAAEYGVALQEEIVRLATHGLLHLTGRVHATEDELSEMTNMTEALVAGYFENGEKA